MRQPRIFEHLLLAWFVLAAACLKVSDGDSSATAGNSNAGDAGDFTNGLRDSGFDGSALEPISLDNSLIDCSKTVWEEMADAGEDGGDYGISIDRKFDTAFEANLIVEAERLAPSHDDIESSVTLGHQFGTGGCVPNSVEGYTDPYDESVRLWCADRFDCICIPYAVTCQTLEYYINVTLAFRGNDFTPSGGITMNYSSLFYLAEVEYLDSFEYSSAVFKGVYVVHLELSWSQSCGNVCALFFTRERFVVFTSEGEVKAVLGDSALLNGLVS